jgi:hypothetical protein
MMLEQPQCPKCGKSGSELTLVGREDRSDRSHMDDRQVATRYAYQCQCGYTFTHSLWDERALNAFK